MMLQMMMITAPNDRVAVATSAAGPASSQLRPPHPSSHTHSYAETKINIAHSFLAGFNSKNPLSGRQNYEK